MSVVRESGEQARRYWDVTGLRYCTDEQMQRARSIEMARLKDAGLPTRIIAKKYRVTPRYVNMLVKMARDSGSRLVASA